VRRVTLDTNEYVSALNGGGRALRLLHVAIDGEIEMAIREPIIAETIRVLREKFDWPPYDLLAARHRLQKTGASSSPKKRSASPRMSRTTVFWNVPPRPLQNSSSARTSICCGSSNTGMRAS
jgi:predicted nucleic acid-binding protein